MQACLDGLHPSNLIRRKPVYKTQLRKDRQKR